MVRNQVRRNENKMGRKREVTKYILSGLQLDMIDIRTLPGTEMFSKMAFQPFQQKSFKNFRITCVP